MKNIFREISRFSLIGIIATLIDFLVLKVLVMDSVMPAWLGKAASFSAGAVFAFIANRNWTFISKQDWVRKSLSFAGVYLSTLLINTVTFSAGLNLLASSSMRNVGAFLIATTCSSVLNFLGLKFIVFRSVDR